MYTGRIKTKDTAKARQEEFYFPTFPKPRTLYAIMRNILIIILFSLTSQLYCQPIFENDSSYFQFGQPTLREIKRKFSFETNVDFEFQFWVAYSKTMKTQTLILTQKNNNWTARVFERIRKGQDTLIELSIDQSKLPQLWKRLNKNKICNIPKDEDLRDKNGNEINDPIYDGIFYYFSFVTKDRQRCYSYRCPKSFSEDYKEVKAYRQVVKVIKLLFQYLGIGYNYIC